MDILTPRADQPLKEARGVILEVNSPPGYFWHYHKRDGAFPVAVAVLQALLGDPANGLDVSLYTYRAEQLL